jgi:hypothetical protein
MFLGLMDLDPLVRGTDPCHKGVENTEIISSKQEIKY